MAACIKNRTMVSVFPGRIAILVNCVSLMISASLYAQDVPHKYALVIGNEDYTGIAKLFTPVNDAIDVAATLERQDFKVKTLQNGTFEEMKEAVEWLMDLLSASPDSCGFFYYAGYAVQSNGKNFLIPADVYIPIEDAVHESQAILVKKILDDMNLAGNQLNIIVLDACRDNPFGWKERIRGLATVNAEQRSIVVHAAEADHAAVEVTGRNSLFTGELLQHLGAPGIDVLEVFRRTQAGVNNLSGGLQTPAMYSEFIGAFYLGEGPVKTEIDETETDKTDTAENESGKARLWTAGFSIGTSFFEPWIIGTVHFSFSPFRNYSFAPFIKNSFFETGFDYGRTSSRPDVTGYYSLYVYAQYCLYQQFAKLGLYAGVGGGYWFDEIDFPAGTVSHNRFPANLIAGILIRDVLNISYTLRTEFSAVNNKFAVGYIHRF